jgi:hypothetical protein
MFKILFITLFYHKISEIINATIYGFKRIIFGFIQ